MTQSNLTQHGSRVRLTPHRHSRLAGRRGPHPRRRVKRALAKPLDMFFLAFSLI